MTPTLNSKDFEINTTEVMKRLLEVQTLIERCARSDDFKTSDPIKCEAKSESWNMVLFAVKRAIKDVSNAPKDAAEYLHCNMYAKR